MNELCNLLGEKPYTELTKKLDGKQLYFSDSKLIPQYRLDEVSKALREQRQKNEDLKEIILAQKVEYNLNIEKLKINCLILKIVALSKPKDYEAVLKFIKRENLALSTAEKSIKYQIRKLKRRFPQLFRPKNEA